MFFTSDIVNDCRPVSQDYRDVCPQQKLNQLFITN